MGRRVQYTEAMNMRVTSTSVLLAGYAFLLRPTFVPVAACRTCQALEWRQGSANQTMKNHFQFKDEEGGSGISKNGNRFSFHVYTSNDGVKILTYIETFPSASRAKRALDEKIKEASSISAHGSKYDKNGKRIGERVVLTMDKAYSTKQSQSFICWTFGSELHWVRSQSLEHALAFEKTLDY